MPPRRHLLARWAEIPEGTAAATVAHVLELEPNPVWSVDQNLRGLALPHSHPRRHAMLGESTHDPIGLKVVHPKTNVEHVSF